MKNKRINREKLEKERDLIGYGSSQQSVIRWCLTTIINCLEDEPEEIEWCCECHKKGMEVAMYKGCPCPHHDTKPTEDGPINTGDYWSHMKKKWEEDSDWMLSAPNYGRLCDEKIKQYQNYSPIHALEEPKHEFVPKGDGSFFIKSKPKKSRLEEVRERYQHRYKAFKVVNYDPISKPESDVLYLLSIIDKQREALEKIIEEKPLSLQNVYNNTLKERRGYNRCLGDLKRIAVEALGIVSEGGGI